MKCAKRVLAGLVALVATVYAWPPPDEVVKTKPIVDELMSAKGALAPADEAEAASAFAEEANGEAAKYLLLRRAVELYAKAGDDGRTADAFQKLVKDVKDVPPAVQERILLEAGRTLAKRVRPLKTEAVFKGVRALVWADKELAAARMELTGSKKNDPAANLRAGNALAVLGDWPKALEHLRGAQGKIAPVAEHEIKGTATADNLANAWWKASAVAESDYVKNAYRQHSVELYRKALEADLLVGLNKTLAENRIAEFEKEGDLSAESATGSASGGSESPRAASAPVVDSRLPSGRSYCIVDLSAGPNATRYPVSYLSAPPIGGWTDKYKTTKLVLRRLEPGSFIMGEDQKDESHRVTLTKPFYIGVFEVTQKQYALVTWAAPSAFKGDMRPVENVSYEMIRGKYEGAKWPSSSAVDTYSFLGKLRMKTGLDFDLPTEAQWEYACRAGTKSTYNNGGDFEDNLKRLGRFVFNQKSRGWWESDADFARHRPDGKGGHSNHHTVVGSYLPNAWGLYDMHGNVHEWCLDWYGELSYGTDPIGVSSSADRVVRGGSWLSTSHCRAASRNKNIPRRGSNDWGFRLAVGHATPTRPSGAAQPTGDVASKNLVRNGSFEADPVKDGDYVGSTPITGWSKDGSVGLIRKNTGLSWKQRYDATTRCFINTGASIKQTINVSRRMNCSVSLNKASMNFFNNGKKFYPSSGYVKIDDMVVISGLATPGGHTKSFTVTVELTPGSHTLKISCTGGRGMSIDDVKVVLAP